MDILYGLHPPSGWSPCPKSTNQQFSSLKVLSCWKVKPSPMVRDIGDVREPSLIGPAWVKAPYQAVFLIGLRIGKSVVHPNFLPCLAPMVYSHMIRATCSNLSRTYWPRNNLKMIGPSSRAYTLEWTARMPTKIATRDKFRESGTRPHHLKYPKAETCWARKFNRNGYRSLFLRINPKVISAFCQWRPELSLNLPINKQALVFNRRRWISCFAGWALPRLGKASSPSAYLTSLNQIWVEPWRLPAAVLERHFQVTTFTAETILLFIKLFRGLPSMTDFKALFECPSILWEFQSPNYCFGLKHFHYISPKP